MRRIFLEGRIEELVSEHALHSPHRAGRPRRAVSAEPVPTGRVEPSGSRAEQLPDNAFFGTDDGASSPGFKFRPASAFRRPVARPQRRNRLASGGPVRAVPPRS
jgi:hypothetical protein